jgi:hypothetical protein
MEGGRVGKGNNRYPRNAVTSEREGKPSVIRGGKGGSDQKHTYHAPQRRGIYSHVHGKKRVGEERFSYENISVIVRRRSLAVERASVCVAPPGDGASSDKCDFAPIVRLPNVIRGCGRSVSEPDCDVHGDVALKGVVGVGAGDSFIADVVRLRASRCCNPLSAFTLTADGREKVIVVECRLLLALEDD